MKTSASMPQRPGCLRRCDSWTTSESTAGRCSRRRCPAAYPGRRKDSMISSLPPRGPHPAAISIPSAASSANASRAVRSARIAAVTGWSAVTTALTESRLGRSTWRWPSGSVPSRTATLEISAPALRHRAGRAGAAWPARYRCGQAEHAQARPGRVPEMTLTPSICCPYGQHHDGCIGRSAGAGASWPVPQCRPDDGRSGAQAISGNPARTWPVLAGLPGRAVAAAGPFSRPNTGRSAHGCTSRVPTRGTLLTAVHGAFLARARTALGSVRGAAGNRATLGQPVLNPC
jgi:hypothetical protein